MSSRVILKNGMYVVEIFDYPKRDKSVGPCWYGIAEYDDFPPANDMARRLADEGKVLAEYS